MLTTLPARAETSAAAAITAELLAGTYAARVHRFAAMVARVDQDAEDLAQEALLRVLRNASGFDAGRGELDAWLWRIVVNVARAAGRRRFLLERLHLRSTELDAAATVEGDALERIDNQRLLAAVRNLPPRARTVVALRFGAGLAYADIAAQIGTSSAAALMATRRALAELRRSLEASEATP